MGIKNLWYILEPHSERKPLYCLEGKTVAIDLSCWVCESLNVVNYFVQPKMYLRNLYFRTSYLLLSGVTPVFVLEGTAPKLKYGIICKRNETNNFIGSKPKKKDDSSKDNPKNAEKGRTHFNYVLKQCEELLRSMGLTCVQAPGEAEAFCAYLNKMNLVDGIISQDSDCFAYGAQRVYRNFTVSAKGGSVDIYDMERIRQHNDIAQNKIIALGLLCGCDYCPNGVMGVGKDSVIKLFEKYKNDEILDKIKSWRDNNYKYTAAELRAEDKTICVNCGHQGTAQKHGSKGCDLCKTTDGCNEKLWKNERLLIKAELNIKKLAMKDATFPSEDVINEFLMLPCELPTLDLNWHQPNMVKFVNNMSQVLQWTELYAFQKILPLFTRCQLKKMLSNKSALSVSVSAKAIEKKRNIKGIPCFDILWSDDKNLYKQLIPENQLISEEADKLWCTTEPAMLIEASYPAVVEEFLVKTQKPKKVPKKRKVLKEIDDPKQPKLGEFVESKTKNKRKKKKVEEIRETEDELNVLIHSFNEIDLDLNKENYEDLNEFNGDSVDLNMTDIVESILKQKPNYTQNTDHEPLQNYSQDTNDDANKQVNTIFKYKIPKSNRNVAEASNISSMIPTIDELVNNLSSDSDADDLNMTDIVENIRILQTSCSNATEQPSSSAHEPIHFDYEDSFSVDSDGDDEDACNLSAAIDGIISTKLTVLKCKDKTLYFNS